MPRYYSIASSSVVNPRCSRAGARTQCVVSCTTTCLYRVAAIAVAVVDYTTALLNRQHRGTQCAHARGSPPR
jgi:hypothetical protein